MAKLTIHTFKKLEFSETHYDTFSIGEKRIYINI